MSALDELVEQVHLMASKIRDENRPSMEFAAACIDDLVKRAIAGAAVGTRMFDVVSPVRSRVLSKEPK